MIQALVWLKNAVNGNEVTCLWIWHFLLLKVLNRSYCVFVLFVFLVILVSLQIDSRYDNLRIKEIIYYFIKWVSFVVNFKSCYVLEYFLKC